LDDNFATFKKFNRTLRFSCENGDPAILEITPNSSWPDIVYYNSFTHANMGWKIHIVDSYVKSFAQRAVELSVNLRLLVTTSLLLVGFRVILS
jgi:hypothetical protein